MDLLLSLVLSTASAAPADSAPAQPLPVLDLEFVQAVLMAEHRLSIPILIRTDSESFDVTPAVFAPR
jgi:hypothetical protein